MTDGPAPELSNETLSAYLDGELDPARARAVERALEHDPEAAARLAAYQRRDELLRLGLADLAVPPADGATATMPRPRDAGGRSFTRRAALAASVAVLLATGGGVGGWLLARRGEQSRLLSELGEQATLAHLAYMRDPTTGAPPSPAAAKQRLRDTLGVAAWVPDLSRFGMHLVAVRAAPAAGTSALVLVYAGADGPPVSCYFAPAGDDRNAPFATRTTGDVNAVYRVGDGIAYAVVGARPVAQLKEIAVAGWRSAVG